LLALVHAGLLNRCFVGTLDGGKKSIYLLTAKGAALVGVSHKCLKRKRDAVLVGDAFIDHQLHINRLYLDFKFGSLPVGVEFGRWRMFTQPLSTTAAIIPDGYVEVGTPAKHLCMFIEVDLGTERIDLWRKKTEAY